MIELCLSIQPNRVAEHWGVCPPTMHRTSSHLSFPPVAMLCSTSGLMQGAVEPAASTPAASGCSTKAAPSCCHSAQQQAPAQRQARCQPARSSGDCQATPERSPAGDDGEEVCQIVGSALKQSAAAAAAAAAGGRLPLGSVHLPIPPLSVEGTQLRGNPANGPQSQPQPCEELPLICGHHPAGGAWCPMHRRRDACWCSICVHLLPLQNAWVCAPGVTALCWLQERQLLRQKTMKPNCCRTPAG